MSWKGEGQRHSLSARGIKSQRQLQIPTTKYKRIKGEIPLAEYDMVPDFPRLEKDIKSVGDVYLSKTPKSKGRIYWIVYTGYDHTIFHYRKYAEPYYNKMVRNIGK